MKRIRSLSILVAITISILIVPGAFAETPAGGTSGPSEYEASIASVEDNRDAVISSIIGNFRTEMDANDEYAGWDVELTAALESAPADKVLAASQASSYAEVVAALFGSWTGPDVTVLEDGESPEDFASEFGENFRDLVFTPLTPCRIIDTRFTAAGILQPGFGRQFQVNLPNFSSQGGFSGSCGIPTTLEVAAVAINVTSTGQTGNGNLRVVDTGGGVPNASLLNYTPGQNLANAAVVRSAIAFGNDIFILSSFAASHAVVDLLGYFAAPLRAPVDNNVLSTTQNIGNGVNFSVFSPICPSGWRLTGGGFLMDQFTVNMNMVAARPVRNGGFLTTNGNGINQANQWLCQGRNQEGSTQPVTCYSVCARTPGR